MHEAAREWVRSHLPQGYRSVLEVGSLDINGGVRDLLDTSASYLGIDVQRGPGVDLVTDFASYKHPERVDLILCLEVFEHLERWRDLIAAAARNLAPGGTLLATCAGPGRPPHSARSEAQIQSDEWYRNVEERELRKALGQYGFDFETDVQGLDLRCVARKRGKKAAVTKVRDFLARKAHRVQLKTESPRILIATPSGDTVLTAYHRSIVGMVGFSIAEGLVLGHQVVQYSMLPLARQVLVQQALEADWTHVLFIDSDMEFPPDLALRLVRHHQPVVAVNCMARRRPYYLTARRENAEEVETGPQSHGIEQVARVGTGIMLIAIDVFRAIPMPWFEYRWLPEKKIFAGEDYVFCDKVRAAGFEIYIDHDVSKQVNHVGTFAYTPLLSAGFKEVERAEKQVAADAALPEARYI